MSENHAPLLDTITAIATPIGVGGIGVIRLSGDRALSLAKACFSGVSDIAPRYVYFGAVVHPQTGERLDEGCLIYFKAPHSFTGEDVVELQLHSNPLLLKRILALLVSLGARLATGGEFTKRAFIYGKLSLEKAESIIDLIESKSMASQGVALAHFEGKLSRDLASYRLVLMQALEQVEASIDFPDEVEPIEKAPFLESLSRLRTHIERMLDLEDYGRVVREGVRCAIVGRPNVGKSSFLNVLLGQDRAIVSGQAGTTRDYIEGELTYRGLLFQFIDTAGIRDSEDFIEQSGIQKIDQVLKESDVVIWMCDGSEPFTPEDAYVRAQVSSRQRVIVVVNKSDLQMQWRVEDVLGDCDRFPSFRVSCSSLEGVDAFKAYLGDLFSTQLERDELSLYCNVRQLSCLKGVHALILSLQEAVQIGLPDDVLAVDLKLAISKLGELTGDALTEEVLDGIFSRFCIGK